MNFYNITKSFKPLAAIFTLSLLSTSASFAGDIAAGKAKSSLCIACHGAQGISAAPNYPNLAGQKEQYLVTSIQSYRSGTRNDPTMKAMTASLTDADINNLAAYFSSLTGK